MSHDQDSNLRNYARLQSKDFDNVSNSGNGMKIYLEERIEWYDHNYRIGTPLISDTQFDHLEANLYRLHPKANYFTKKTKLPLPSLPKDRIKEFLNGLTLQTRLIIEPKIDGCAIAIQYLSLIHI